MSGANGKRILIVEDEPKLAAVLRDYLVADGAQVELLHHGDDALPALRLGVPDLVLLDLMLPGTDVRELINAEVQPASGEAA